MNTIINLELIVKIKKNITNFDKIEKIMAAKGI